MPLASLDQNFLSGPVKVRSENPHAFSITNIELVGLFVDGYLFWCMDFAGREDCVNIATVQLRSVKAHISSLSSSDPQHIHRPLDNSIVSLRMAHLCPEDVSAIFLQDLDAIRPILMVDHRLKSLTVRRSDSISSRAEWIFRIKVVCHVPAKKIQNWNG